VGLLSQILDEFSGRPLKGHRFVTNLGRIERETLDIDLLDPEPHPQTLHLSLPKVPFIPPTMATIHLLRPLPALTYLTETSLPCLSICHIISPHDPRILDDGGQMGI
jgi:hypothetical protein